MGTIKISAIIMRTIIIIASVIIATSAFPQSTRDPNYVPKRVLETAPAQREGSNGPVSHSPPKNAVKATRDPNYVPNRVLATRDPNYVPKRVLATRDPNYVQKVAPAQREGSNVPASHSPPKNVVRATRDPNYIEKANPTCDCSKIRQQVQAVPLNTANLAPAQQEGKPSAPVKPLKNVVSATRDPNYCNCSNTEEVIEVFEVDYDYTSPRI